MLLAAAVHATLASAGFGLTTPAEPAPFWISAGLDVALVVLLGRRAAAGVLAGGTLVCIAHAEPAGTGLGIAAANALAALAAGALITRFVDPQGRLRRRRDLLVIVLAAAPAAATLSASGGVASLALSGSLPLAELRAAWWMWFLAHVAGIVVLTPPVLILARHGRPRISARWVAEASVLLGTLVLAFVLAAGEGAAETSLVGPVIVWAALRFGLPGAAFVALLSSALAVVLTVRGVGSFGERGGMQALLHAQAIMTVNTLTGVLLAALGEERKGAVRRERTARRHVQAFMDHSPAEIFIKDLAGRHVGVNRRFAEHHAPGRDPIGLTDADLFAPDAAVRHHTSDLAVVRTGVPRTEVEHLDGAEGRRTFETIKFPVLDEAGAVAGVAGIATDVTDRDVAEREREEAVRQLAHRVHHDALTGLPNRGLIDDRLQEALARAEADGTTLAVILLDLDQFKYVNDSLGHHTGDDLLRQVAPRLRAAARPQDTVGRFGGDEFVVLCEGLAGPWEALAVARRLAAAWAEPFRLGDDDVFISGSAGVAVTHAGRAGSVALLREADAAMYRAKARGRGDVELYDEVMRACAYDRLTLEGDLRRALADGEIEVAFQPIVDLEDGRPLAVEALARWTHPVRGPVSPAVFIAVAEESGLIADLGRHVLRTACERLARWRAELPGAEALQVSVNVSARQIARGELPGDVKDALRVTGLPPAALALEVTESALMEETDAPGPVLASLRSLGVKIVLDDFGTGYSSLSYLRRFPLDGLKLDRSFVDGLAQPDAAAVVAAIIEMGATLGLVVTAEGVETRGQAEQLRALGCPRGQGYVLARPLPPAEAALALAEGLRRRPTLRLAPEPGRSRVS